MSPSDSLSDGGTRNDRYRPIADLARAPERTSLNHFKADA